MSWTLRHEPRKWQEEAIDAWEKNGHRGIAKIVTGGGKTYFSFMCMNQALKYGNSDIKFLIVVPTIALRDQWTLDLIEDFNVKRDEIYCHGEDKIIHKGHRIVLMVINSARTRSSEISSSGNWMLIVDECHRAGSEENRNVLIGNWSFTLGLSATPERQYDEWFEEFLVPSLGNIIADYDYKSAKKDGVISDFELRNYFVPMTDEEEEVMSKLNRSISIERRRMKDEGLVESKKLLNLLLKRSRHSQALSFRIPIAVKASEEFIGKKIIIFHESIQYAEILEKLMDLQGFRTTIYHSRLTPIEKYSNLRDFKLGLKDVLVTCRALDEGLNVEDAEIGIIVASTKSTRQRIQRLGRVLRTSKEKERSIVLTMYSIAEEDQLISEARKLEDLVEVKWFGGE